MGIEIAFNALIATILFRSPMSIKSLIERLSSTDGRIYLYGAASSGERAILKLASWLVGDSQKRNLLL